MDRFLEQIWKTGYAIICLSGANRAEDMAIVHESRNDSLMIPVKSVGDRGLYHTATNAIGEFCRGWDATPRLFVDFGSVNKQLLPIEQS